jgi:hypothetical protein
MDKEEVFNPLIYKTKAEMITGLQKYYSSPDDDTIRIKNKIKEMLLGSPQLLWALNNQEYEAELFNDDGTLNVTGEWDVYYGDTSLIRPFLFIPETQDVVANYICFQTSTDENMRYAPKMKYFVITFTIIVHEKDSIDKETGIQRHDLIGSIIRELMAWSSLSMANAIPIYENESVTDNNYITKVLRYRISLPNNLVVTDDRGSEFVNKTKR